MTGEKVQRIRFGILAARCSLTSGRMTLDQIEYVHVRRGAGWNVGESVTWKAWNRECAAMRRRGWLQS